MSHLNPFQPARATVRADVLAMIDSYLANGGRINRVPLGASGLADDEWQDWQPFDGELPDDIAALVARPII